MATRRFKHNVQATERDKALIQYLGEHGCASSEQIAALFWPGRKTRTCVERLDLLVKAGFVHSAAVHCRGEAETIYWIERKGSQLFAQDVRCQFQTGRPPMAEIAHILNTNDAVYKMSQKARVIGFRHEHILKSMKARTNSKRHVADAHVTIEREGRTYSFLLEIDGKYHGKMLSDKVQDYGASGRPIVWVVYSKGRLAHLRTLCTRFLNIRPVLFDSL